MVNGSVMSRKDMREPDRFQVVANQAAAWVAARKKQVALIGGAVVVVVLVVAVVATIQASRAEAVGTATSALLETVASPVLAKAPEGATYKTFPTDEAKQKAIVAEADRVVAEHGGSGAALALLVKADALYALKDWDGAAAGYEAFLRTASKDDSLRFGALDGLGLVAEAKGDLAGAAAAYERLAKEVPGFADHADLERARVLAAAGKKDEARQLLAKFGEAHKDSTLAGLAAQRLADLGAK
ncbi:MAG TPA: tetratricopeptide repeat protein [Anaeromyxobacter sp.]|nr:tetratricopeptide repeat protein [Anaeromyxobacter sp.]